MTTTQSDPAKLAELKAAGATIVKGAEAKKIFSQGGDQPAYNFVDLEAVSYEAGGNKKWKNVLPAGVKTTAVVHPSTGVVHQVLERSTAVRYAKATQPKKERAKDPGQVRWENERKLKKAVGQALVPAILQKAEKLTPAAALKAWLLAVLELGGRMAVVETALRRELILAPEKGRADYRKALVALREEVQTMVTEKNLVGILLELEVSGEHDHELRKLLARHLKLDTKALTATVKTAQKEKKTKAKPVKKPAKKAPAKKKGKVSK